MKLTLAAVGRLRDGPEATLVSDYLNRVSQTGRQLALGPVSVTEIDERKARSRDLQSSQLLASIPQGARAVALDERGKAMTSRDFATWLALERDQGTPEMVFLIGGADGHDAALREKADRLISFGPMVWPHMLARVMLAEQLYRAVSILANSPYHRD